MRVNELHDDDAEYVFVRNVVRRPDFRQTAKQIAETASAGAGRMIGGKQFEESIPDGSLLLIKDGIACSVDKDAPRPRAPQ